MRISNSLSLEQEYWDFLSTQAKLLGISRNDYVQKIVDDLRNGITTQPQTDLKTRQEVAKTELLEKKVDLTTQKIRGETATSSIKELHLGSILKYVDNFGTFPTKQGFSAIQKGIPKPDNQNYLPNSNIKIPDDLTAKQWDWIYCVVVQNYDKEEKEKWCLFCTPKIFFPDTLDGLKNAREHITQEHPDKLRLAIADSRKIDWSEKD